MTPDAFASEWAIIERFLPADWRDQARALSAIRAEKGITDPEVLLRLLLMHAGTGLSLKSTVGRAKAQGLADISSVALFKRLQNAGPWLAKLGQDLFTKTRFVRRREVTPSRQLRAVDATVVTEPGPRGSRWRVHYSVAMPALSCDFYALTSPSAAETFLRIPVDRGDILLGDRAYCHRKAVAHVVERGGDVIVRLNIAGFPLMKPDGSAFNILEHLRTLQGFKPHSWPVRFSAHGRRYRGRLCAIRKTETATQKTLRRMKDADRHHGVKTKSPEAIEAAGYIFLFTTVRRRELPLRDVMELYRARWQIELVFKRLKSLLKFGQLPKHSNASSRAWLQAKLLTVLLTERLAEEARLFSPWGHDEPSPQ
jgi:hypothetical protein